MELDSIRHMHIFQHNYLTLLGRPHGQQWMSHLPGSWCEDGVPESRIRSECVFALTPADLRMCSYVWTYALV